MLDSARTHRNTRKEIKMIAPKTPGFDFNRATITSSAPAKSGVYALCTAAKWIYVGEGKDIQKRLLDHLDGDNPCINRAQPTVFQYELIDANQRVARQDVLIAQLGTLAPAGCNQKLG
jgi:hypothetical protein